MARSLMKSVSWLGLMRMLYRLIILISNSSSTLKARSQDQEEGDSSVVHHHFIKAALQPLVAMLLEQLTKQVEFACPETPDQMA